MSNYEHVLPKNTTVARLGNGRPPTVPVWQEEVITHPAYPDFNASQEPNHVLQTVTQQTAALLKLAGCIIFEWNHTTGSLIALTQHWEATLPADTSTANLSFDTNSTAQKTLSDGLIRKVSVEPTTVQTPTCYYFLPMIFQGEIVGLAVMIPHYPHTLSEQEISLAQLMASQAAGVLENARLYDEVHQRVDELTALNTISQVITSTLNLPEMLGIITDLTTRLLNVAATSVVLHREDEANLYYAAASGAGAKFIRDKELPVGQGITGWVVAHGESLVVNDTKNDSRFLSQFDRQSGFTTESILCVPLEAKGRITGAITAMNKKDTIFDQKDIRLLSALAAPAAIAIENARLYEQAQKEIAERKQVELDLDFNKKFSHIYAQQLEAMEILHDVGLRLMHNLDTKSVLDLTNHAVLDLIPEATGCIMHFPGQSAHNLLPEVYAGHAPLRSNHLGHDLKELVGRTVETGEAISVPDVSATTLLPHLADVQIQSLLALPLVDHQHHQKLGALTVYGAKPHLFTDTHQYILSILANQAAVALRKACFFEARKQAQEQEKQAIREMFQRYVNPAVVERLVEGREDLALGGKRQEVSILFADIRGFTTFSEHQPPEQLVEVLNQYFAMAVHAIMGQEGTLDKFMGDAVMAIFNAPLSQPDHIRRAVQAALTMQRTIIEHSLTAAPRHQPLTFGIGVHVGPAVVGNIGTAQQMNYTAIGDTVNVAKRLQENAGGGQILLSQAVYNAIKDDAVVKDLGPMTIKGRTAAENVYILLDLADGD